MLRNMLADMLTSKSFYGGGVLTVGMIEIFVGGPTALAVLLVLYGIGIFFIKK